MWSSKVRAVFTHPENSTHIDSSAGLVKLRPNAEYSIIREVERNGIEAVYLDEIPFFAFTKGMFTVYDASTSVTQSEQVESLFNFINSCRDDRAAASAARRKKYYAAQEKLARNCK